MIGISAHSSSISGPVRRLHALARNRRSLALFDQAIISVTNMCTSVIIGRTCPKAQLGLYASGLSLILLVTAVQSALIAVPYTISSPQISKADHPLYKGSTLLQQITLACVAMLVFFSVGRLGLRKPGDGLQPVLLALALVCGMICFRDFARRVSYAELHFGFALTIDGVLSLVQLLSIALLAWNHQLTAVRALLAVGLASAVASLMWVTVNWSSISLSPRHAIRGFRVNWALGKWLLSSSVLWSICIDQYPWLITAWRVPAEAAVWASAYGVMAFLNPIVLALNNEAAPRVSNDYARAGVNGLSHSVRRSALIAGAITLPVLVALLIFGSRLVRLMYGAKFAGSGPIVDLLAIGLWFYAISLSFPYGMLALKRANVDFAINVVCILSFLALGVPLIRSQGVLGAACSFLVVQTVALVLRVVSFHHIVRRASREPMPTRAAGAAA